jgi:hypothetical protein
VSWFWFSWTGHRGVDAKSPPNRRDRIVKPTAGLVRSGNDPPRRRQRLSDDQLPRSIGPALDNVLINVVTEGAFEGAQVEVGFRRFDSRKMHHRTAFCAGRRREFRIRT